MNTLRVSSQFGSYSVNIVDNVSKTLQFISHDQPCHLLIDQTIWNLHRTFFSNIKWYSKKIFVAKEQYKSLDSINSYITFLLKHGFRKNHIFIVVGGGLVQDIGSFSAHILLRGVKWIFFPTTLMSMADSCIGSKSGINVGNYKNQLGAFHPPQRVYIYLPFIKTLSREMMYDGYGEILKHAIIKGGKTFSYITDHIQKIQEKDTIARDIIMKSLMVKKEIVEHDEFDIGQRKFLNYGHTFGHALEGYMNNAIYHGVAVSIGMDMANYISMRRGLLPEKTFTKLSKILHQSIPNQVLPIDSVSRYMDFIAHDKKVVGNTVYALLCKGVGNVIVDPIQLDTKLRKDIEAYIASYQKIHNE